MNQTDYLMVLASIVVGLALAELLKGIGQFMRTRDSVRTYWIQSLVAVNALLFLLQFWWSMWSWREQASWTPVGLLLLVTGVVALYLLSFLAFPDELSGTDLRDYYFSHSAHMWAMVTIWMLVGLVAPRLILRFAWVLDAPMVQQLFGVGIAMTLAMSKRASVHAVLVSVVTAVNVLILLV